jgi:hypothetical protein
MNILTCTNPLNKPLLQNILAFSNRTPELQCIGMLEITNTGLKRVILFAVTEFLATGSQVPLLLVIDAI